jgi:hypothetical protein
MISNRIEGNAFMNRSLLLTCILLALGSPALAATDSAVAPKAAVVKAKPPTAKQAPTVTPVRDITAAQVVERNVAARGGLEAWRAVKTITMAGQLDAGGKADPQLPFVMKMKRPNKSRVELTFQDQTAVQVYDGTKGWKLRPFLNRNDVEPYTAAEAKAATAWQELDGPLVDYAAKGTKVELLGSEIVDGKPNYKLALTLKNGDKRNLWVDAATFLENKIDGDPRRIDGRMRPVTVFYRAYKTENKLTTPRQFETVVAGVTGSHKMEISRVTVNENMPDTLFDRSQLAMAATATPAATPAR